VAMNERTERSSGAVSIPEGENSIVIKAWVGIYFFVCATVSAVVIIEQGGPYHSVVQRSIEYLPGAFVSGLYVDLGQLFRPFGIGAVHNLVKIPAGDLRIDIGQRIFTAYRGDAHFEHYL